MVSIGLDAGACLGGTHLGSRSAVGEGRRSRRSHLAAGVEGYCSHKALLVVEVVRHSHSFAEAEECRSRSRRRLVEGMVAVSMRVEEGRSHRAAGRRTRFVQGRTTFAG